VKPKKTPVTAAQKLAANCEQAANEILAMAHVRGLSNQAVHDAAAARIMRFVQETTDEAARSTRESHQELVSLRKEIRNLISDRQATTQLWHDLRTLGANGRRVAIRSYMQRILKSSRAHYQVVQYPHDHDVLGAGDTPQSAMTKALALSPEQP